MTNLPQQTGIIDFLRRLDNSKDRTFLDQFNEDPEKLMTLCGLSATQQRAILSGDNGQIAAEVGKEFFLPPMYDFVRFAHPYSKKWHLDYEFPDPPPPAPGFTARELVARLQQDVKRIDGLIARLAISLQ